MSDQLHPCNKCWKDAEMTKYKGLEFNVCSNSDCEQHNPTLMRGKYNYVDAHSMLIACKIASWNQANPFSHAGKMLLEFTTNYTGSKIICDCCDEQMDSGTILKSNHMAIYLLLPHEPDCLLITKTKLPLKVR